MKISSFIIFIFFTATLYAQSDTEVFLFDLESSNKIEVKNGKNISNNKGYNNQPSFLDDRYILFSSTRDGQTDIAKYDTQYNSKTWINSSEGGEYTPLKIPNKNSISAVRLDKDGKQRLYAYDASNGESTELIKDLVVAYYTWYNEDILVSAVIENEELNLYSSNIKEGTNKKIASNVGRSFHKIPNSNLISFISKANPKQWQIKSLNPITGDTKLIANTLKGIEDICWLNSTNLLSGKKGILYKLTLQKDYNWKKVENLKDYGILNITRLATNKEGSKLLIAAEIDPDISSSYTVSNEANTIEDEAGKIIDKHIDLFNNRNLKDFSKTLNVNVLVKDFPSEIKYYGRDNLIENYTQFFKENEKSNLKVLNRIALKNIIVEEELLSLNSSTKRQVTIYETENDKVTSMTSIENSKFKKKQEALINEHVKMYNEKDVKALGRTYAKDVMIYNFPDEVVFEDRSAVRDDYIALSESTPNLYAEVLNRIIIGNKVIDKIKLTKNDQFEYFVAIYEITNNLIDKVTYIR